MTPPLEKLLADLEKQTKDYEEEVSICYPDDLPAFDTSKLPILVQALGKENDLTPKQ